MWQMMTAVHWRRRVGCPTLVTETVPGDCGQGTQGQVPAPALYVSPNNPSTGSSRTYPQRWPQPCAPGSDSSIPSDPGYMHGFGEVLLQVRARGFKLEVPS